MTARSESNIIYENSDFITICIYNPLLSFNENVLLSIDITNPLFSRLCKMVKVSGSSR
ncbi:MAG: hypothetical protein ACTSQJ_15770 [Promethearchaeota archaeon]